MRYSIITLYAFLILFPATPEYLCAEEYRVTMKSWVFTPNALIVNSGDTVIWINDDDTHHKIIFEDPSLKNSENIKPEKKYLLTFDKPGEYRYNCLYHNENGMHGTVTVKGTDK